MNQESVGLLGIIVSVSLLLVTGNPAWLLATALSGIYFGWNIGQRFMPEEV